VDPRAKQLAENAEVVVLALGFGSDSRGKPPIASSPCHRVKTSWCGQIAAINPRRAQPRIVTSPSTPVRS
jgi:hypothetical protein